MRSPVKRSLASPNRLVFRLHSWFPFVMVGLVPTILYARSGALLDPRDKPEDDTCTFWCAGSTSRASSSASSSGMPRR